jgi:hypothetical protein
MPTQTKRTALQAYMENQTAVLALVERIHEAIENHDTDPTPEAIHWGHVGDIAEIRSELQALSDRLFFEGEFAPQAK